MLKILKSDSCIEDLKKCVRVGSDPFPMKVDALITELALAERNIEGLNVIIEEN